MRALLAELKLLAVLLGALTLVWSATRYQGETDSTFSAPADPALTFGSDIDREILPGSMPQESPMVSLDLDR